MCTQSIDRSDAMVPLLTAALVLGVAAASVATRSVATPTAVAYGTLASAVVLLAGFVGRVAWALYAATRAAGTSQRRRIDRSGPA